MMKLIAHRGLIDGPSKSLENQPNNIEASIQLGFEAEVDLRIRDGEPWLGHDNEQYKVSANWLERYYESLWIHCKTIDALEYCHNSKVFNYFSHESDGYVVTSAGFIWAYPGNLGKKGTILVMPENKGLLHSVIALINDGSLSVGGICSDFVERISNETNGCH